MDRLLCKQGVSYSRSAGAKRFKETNGTNSRGVHSSLIFRDIACFLAAMLAMFMEGYSRG